MQKLTPRQAEILAFIKRCLEDNGYPPTRAEIAQELGFKSPNAAEEHLKALARKGAIEMTPGASRGIRILQHLGFQSETMGRVEYWLGTLLAAAFIVLMFFALYKFLPNRRIRWQSAMLAALVTSVLFELAKTLFTTYVGKFNPGTLYTGTLYALVIIVFWVYYAALIFIIGGEVGRVYELRRVRRLQRETLEG